jgi:hypothetical protein
MNGLPASSGYLRTSAPAHRPSSAHLQGNRSVTSRPNDAVRIASCGNWIVGGIVVGSQPKFINEIKATDPEFRCPDSEPSAPERARGIEPP